MSDKNESNRFFPFATKDEQGEGKRLYFINPDLPVYDAIGAEHSPWTLQVERALSFATRVEAEEFINHGGAAEEHVELVNHGFLYFFVEGPEDALPTERTFVTECKESGVFEEVEGKLSSEQFEQMSYDEKCRQYGFDPKGHMEPDIEYGEFAYIDGDQGTQYVPMEFIDEKQFDDFVALVETSDEALEVPDGIADYFENKTAHDAGRVTGYGCRLSAPGYMDATDWGLADSEQGAWEELSVVYGDFDQFDDEHDDASRKSELRYDNEPGEDYFDGPEEEAVKEDGDEDDVGPDVEIENHGTVWIFRLINHEAEAWVEDNIPNIPDYMLQEDGFTADWRPARDIANGMTDAGLTIEIDKPIPGLLAYEESVTEQEDVDGPEGPFKQEPSNAQQELNSLAVELANKAAGQDTWMTPVFEKEESRESYETWSNINRQGWEETDHFSVYYRRPIYDLAYDLFDDNDREQAMYAAEEAIGEFWEQWETQVGAYEKWQAWAGGAEESDEKEGPGPFDAMADDTGVEVLNERELSVPEKHQKKIAIDTLKLSDAGAKIMGGMTKDQAHKFLRSIGYTGEQIAGIENVD